MHMLHTLSPAPGSRSKRIRRGRGSSAGRGTTAGRGTKGQGSRAGSGRKPGFEGGQTPLMMRQPKLGGFRNPKRIEYEVVNLADIEKLSAGTYSVTDFRSSRMVGNKKPVKLLGRGSVTKKYALTVHAASKSACAAVEKAGGSITIVK